MKNLLLENVGVGTELAKRTHLEDVKIKRVCDCGEELEKDLSNDYLSYPVVGYPETLNFYCDKCEKDFDDVTVTLSINLTVNYKDSEDV